MVNLHGAGLLRGELLEKRGSKNCLVRMAPYCRAQRSEAFGFFLGAMVFLWLFPKKISNWDINCKGMDSIPPKALYIYIYGFELKEKNMIDYGKICGKGTSTKFFFCGLLWGLLPQSFCQQIMANQDCDWQSLRLPGPSSCQKLEGKRRFPRFPYGYPMVILWLSYGYPMVILWLSYGYPMVILWLSYGFYGI